MSFCPRNRVADYDTGLDLTDFDSPRPAPPRHEPVPSEANPQGRKLVRWGALILLTGLAYQQYWSDWRIVGVVGLSFMAAILLIKLQSLHDGTGFQRRAKRQDNNDIQFN